MTNGEFNLYAFGISHKTSNVETREKLQLSRKEIPEALKFIKENEAVEGITIVTTCNRIEFYIVMKGKVSPLEIIAPFYYNKKNIKIREYHRQFYLYEELDAARHLFRVISGLESLVLGEYQVLGQIRESYSIACEAKTVDKILHKLLHAAFRAGKKVRTETKISEGKQSVSGVASQIILENLDKNQRIAIVGVNENTKILAEEIKNAGFNNFVFVNRTLYKAEMMVEQYGGFAAGLDQIEKVLFDTKAVFSSTGSPGYIVGSEMLKRLSIQDRCPTVIIDMAVPRDFETAGLPETVKVFDIGMLKEYLDRITSAKSEYIPEAERIVEDEVKVWQAWTEYSSNTILEPYAEKFEMIRQQLMGEYRDQFSDNSFEKADKLSRSLMHRLQSQIVRILVNETKKTE
jgi:glutamyl-tRNA reductase